MGQAPGSLAYYEVQQQLNSGSWSTRWTGHGTVSGSQLSTLLPSPHLSLQGDYRWRIRACHASGSCSSWTTSPTSRLSVPPLPIFSADTPAVNVTGEYTVSWGAVAAAARYTLRENGVARPDITSTRQSFSGGRAKASGSYGYQVRACNVIGCSGYSATQTIQVVIPEAGGESSGGGITGGDVVSTPPSATSSSELVGVTDGVFRVDESGAAGYSIPLALPEGTAGVAPQLSVNYSSQGGNGLLGKGWSLGGVSSITRCRQTLAQDGLAGTIGLNQQDRFCLDGHRLVLMSGRYGAPGSTYKTEIDSFARVRAIGGSDGHPNAFSVEGRDGSMSTFGGTPDARLQLSSKTLTWALTRFEDSVGNRINYHYEGSAESGHRLRFIDFAYPAVSSNGSFGARVEFHYELRPDPLRAYVAGHAVNTPSRLAEIESFSQGNAFRRYRLHYDEYPVNDKAGFYSRLTSLEECVAEQCLPKTTFSWSNQARFGWERQNLLSLDVDVEILDVRYLDFNGNGAMDTVWVEKRASGTVVKASVGTGATRRTTTIRSFSSQSPPKMEVLDYNADGRQDITIFDEFHQRWNIYVTGPRADGTWEPGLGGATPPFVSKAIKIADVTSNGLNDVIELDAPNRAIRVYELSKDSTASSASQQYYQFQNSPQSYSLTPPGLDREWEMDDEHFIAGDFSGNGRMDVLVSFVRKSSGLTLERRFDLFLYGRNGFQHARTFSVGLSLDRASAVDFNGDGLSDLALLSGNGWHYAINTGDRFTALKPIHDATRYGPYKLQDKNATFVDYNRDGYTDLVWRSNAGSTSGYMMIKYWSPEVEGFSKSQNFYTVTSQNAIYGVADMTGDGHSNIVEFTNARQTAFGAHPAINIFKGQIDKSGLIEEITTGSGDTVRIRYEALSDTEHYSTIEGIQSVGSEVTVCDGGYTIPYGGGTVGEVCREKTVYSADSDDFYRQMNAPFADLPTDVDALGEFPILHAAGPLQVVTKVESSAPTAEQPGHTRGVNYYYHQARFQAGGRGFLGFRKLTSIDLQKGIEVETEYRQDWPYARNPYRTTTRSVAGHLINEAVNIWDVKAFGSVEDGTRRYQPYIKTSIERSYDLVDGGVVEGALQKTVTTESDYDNEGNLTHSRVETEGGGVTQTQVTQNEYGTSDWEQRLGRLSRSQVTTLQDGYAVTRTSAFTYHTSGPLKGLLRTEVTEPDAPSYQRTTTYAYDAWGNVTGTRINGAGVAARGQQTIYDQGRFVQSKINALGQTTLEVLERNDHGLPTRIQDLKGVITEIRYDALGREVLRQDATGAWVWSGQAFCSSGVSCPAGAVIRVESRVAGGGREWTYSDALGREIRSGSIDFEGRSVYTDQDYDAAGRLKRKSNPYFAGETPLGWTEFQYDLLDRVVETQQPDGNRGRTDYEGHHTYFTNPLGEVRRETRDVLGRLTEVEDSMGGHIRYQYDPLGNLLSATTEAPDSASVTVRMCYDVLGRKVAMHDPGKGGFRGNAGADCSTVVDNGSMDGWWYYTYNVFGELTAQTDAKKQRVEQTYDSLGRQLTRTSRLANGSVEDHTRWHYDQGQDGKLQVGGVGNLTAVTVSHNGISETCGGSNLCTRHVYDAFGRLVNTVRRIPGDGTAYVSGRVYDSIGRVFANTDVLSGLVATGDSGTLTRYNEYGYPYRTLDIESGDPLHEILETNARGQVVRERRAGSAETVYRYDDRLGHLLEQQAYAVSSVFPIQDITYEWDELGNLRSRDNQSINSASGGRKDLRESFCYDGLNRLVKSHRGRLNGSCSLSSAEQDVRYDGMGNITWKDGVGNYTYANNSNAGPQAVTNAGGTGYQYDHNGNLVSGDGRTLAYTVHDKPNRIISNGHTTDLFYGAGRERYRRVDRASNGKGTTDTLYLGSVERIARPNGTVEWKRHIAGAVYTVTTNNTNVRQGQTERLFIYEDHLGSTDVLVGWDGIVVQPMSFEPLGHATKFGYGSGTGRHAAIRVRS